MTIVTTFVTEATEASGRGHLSRCLALAEALQEAGGRCRFVGQFDAEAQAILSTARFEYHVHDLGSAAGFKEAINLLQTQTGGAVVADSYGFTPHKLREIRAPGRALLVIDDFADLDSYPCDAILNFTVSAPRLAYPPSPAIKLLGLRYFLARKALRTRRATGDPEARTQVRRALVAIGGVDLHDLTRRCLKAILQTGTELQVRAIVGANWPHRKSVSSLLERLRPAGQMIVRAPTLADHLCWADVCISGGGLTKYEAAYLSVPTAVVSQTSRQADESVHFARAGLAVDIGLGPAVNDAQLVQHVGGFLNNTEQLRQLRRACLTSFPADPTAAAAQAVMHLAEDAACK